MAARSVSHHPQLRAGFSDGLYRFWRNSRDTLRLRHFPSHHLKAVDEEGIGQPTPAHVAAQSGDEGGLRVLLELGAARACRPATTKAQALPLQYRTYRPDLPTRPTGRPVLQRDVSAPSQSDPVCWGTSARPDPKRGMLRPVAQDQQRPKRVPYLCKRSADTHCTCTRIHTGKEPLQIPQMPCVGKRKAPKQWPGRPVGHGVCVQLSTIPDAGDGLFVTESRVEDGDFVTGYDGWVITGIEARGYKPSQCTHASPA